MMEVEGSILLLLRNRLIIYENLVTNYNQLEPLKTIYINKGEYTSLASDGEYTLLSINNQGFEISSFDFLDRHHVLPNTPSIDTYTDF